MSLQIVFKLVYLSLPLVAACSAVGDGWRSQELGGQLKLQGQIDSVERWVEHYYQHQDRDALAKYIPRAFEYLSSPQSRAQSFLPTVVFVSEIFRANPSRVETWLQEFETMDRRYHQYIWQAARIANGGDVKEALNIRFHISSEDVAKGGELQVLDVRNVKIDSADLVDSVWGAFFATGDKVFVKRVIDLLPGDGSDLKSVKRELVLGAEWSLAALAKEHPIVLEMCREEHAGADGVRRATLRRILVSAGVPAT